MVLHAIVFARSSDPRPWRVIALPHPRPPTSCLFSRLSFVSWRISAIVFFCCWISIKTLQKRVPGNGEIPTKLHKRGIIFMWSVCVSEWMHWRIPHPPPSSKDGVGFKTVFFVVECWPPPWSLPIWTEINIRDYWRAFFFCEGVGDWGEWESAGQWGKGKTIPRHGRKKPPLSGVLRISTT